MGYLFLVGIWDIGCLLIYEISDWLESVKCKGILYEVC